MAQRQKILNIRGHQNRVDLCRKYEVKALLRSQLLQGVSILSDAGAMLTREYYLFTATSSEGALYTIVCGEDAAADLLAITGQEKPNMFRILAPDALPGSRPTPEKKPGSKLGRETKSQVDRAKWHPLTEQFYHAVCTLIVAWGDTGANNSILYQQLEFCTNYGPLGLKPYDSRLKALNTICGKTRQKTLRGLLKELEQKGNRLTDYDYSLLDETIKKLGIVSHI